MADEELPPKPVICPFCDSTDNELFSLFGQTLIGSQHYCRNCHTVFEAVRWSEEEESASASNQTTPKNPCKSA